MLPVYLQITRYLGVHVFAINQPPGLLQRSLDGLVFNNRIKTTPSGPRARALSHSLSLSLHSIAHCSIPLLFGLGTLPSPSSTSVPTQHRPVVPRTPFLFHPYNTPPPTPPVHRRHVSPRYGNNLGVTSCKRLANATAASERSRACSIILLLIAEMGGEGRVVCFTS